MLAAQLIRPGSVELTRAPVPSPGPGEVLLRVETALTCGTDLKTYRRGHPRIPLPSPMGHEFSGRVATVGEGVDAFREGDPVAAVPTAPCGSCRLCRRGRPSLCDDGVGRMVFGAFAEYLLLPEHIVQRHLFARPASMPPHVAAALEPLACVVHGLGRVDLERAETVLLIGDGPIALLFLQLARSPATVAATTGDTGASAASGADPAGSGRRVLLAGKHALRLDAARQLGADAAVDVGEVPLDHAVRDWTDGRGADLVIECVGRPEVWESAAALAAVGGEVLLYGGCAAGARVVFDPYRIHYEEVDVKGAFHYDPADVRRAFALLRAGAVDIDALVTHRVPLTRLEEGLELALSRQAIKVAIEP